MKDNEFFFKEGPIGKPGEIHRIVIADTDEFGLVSLQTPLPDATRDIVNRVASPKRLAEEASFIEDIFWKREQKQMFEDPCFGPMR